MARTKHFDSESIPGASFDLLIIGRMVRHRAELNLADQRHQQRMIAQRKLSILPELEFAEAEKERFKKAFDALKPEDRGKLDRLQIQEELLADEVFFSYVRTMLVKFSIPGDEYAGITSTDELLESGPIPFVDEIILQAMLMWKVSNEERKNLPPLSISEAGPMAGVTPDMTVTSASEEPITEPATAS